MIYQRPTVGSLKMWADAVGDESYSWEEWLKYFKVGSSDSSTGVFAYDPLQKSVQFTPPDQRRRAANATAEYDASAFDNEGAGGPLRVSYANYAGPFSSYMEGALNEIGVGRSVEGFNSGKQIVVFSSPGLPLTCGLSFGMDTIGIACFFGEVC